MSAPDRRRTVLHRMAWLCLALALAITSLSAWIRLSRAGLGCADRVACQQQARLAAHGQAEPLPDGNTLIAARLAHRVLASAVLLLVLAIVMSTLARPRHGRQVALALALLGLVLLLASIGRWSAVARMAAPTLVNLIGGFLLAGCAWLLLRGASPAESRPRAARRPAAPATVLRPSTPTTALRPAAEATMRSATPQAWMRCWARLASLLLLAVVALGGLVSANYAGLACPRLVCPPAAFAGQAFAAWREPQLDLQGATVGAELLHQAHRLGALLLAALVLPLGIAAMRHGRRMAGALLLALLVLQVLLGVTLVVAALPLAAALAHNLAALLLLITLFELARTGEPALRLR